MDGFTPLDIASGTLRARLLPCGAALVGVHLAGSDRNLVLGFADPRDHARFPVYAGSIVGPVANRIAGARIDIDGTPYALPRNDGGNTLHSGPEGMHARVWQVRSHDRDCATMALELPDGACGLPGRRVIIARYSVMQTTLQLILTATTDRTTAINLAPHAYWNLDGSDDIATHRLHIAANRYLPNEAQNLPTGDVLPLRDTPFDFTTSRPVPRDPRLDVNYCLWDAPAAALHPAATLTGAGGTRMELATNAPGLQVYNGTHLPDAPGVLTGGHDLRPFCAMALEPQFWPDAPRHPHFPSILLRPHQTFRQITRYRIAPAR